MPKFIVWNPEKCGANTYVDLLKKEAEDGASWSSEINCRSYDELRQLLINEWDAEPAIRMVDDNEADEPVRKLGEVYTAKVALWQGSEEMASAETFRVLDLSVTRGSEYRELAAFINGVNQYAHGVTYGEFVKQYEVYTTVWAADKDHAVGMVTNEDVREI